MLDMIHIHIILRIKTVPSSLICLLVLIVNALFLLPISLSDFASVMLKWSAKSIHTSYLQQGFRRKEPRRISPIVDMLLTGLSIAVLLACVFGEKAQFSEIDSPWTLTQNVL